MWQKKLIKTKPTKKAGVRVSKRKCKKTTKKCSKLDGKCTKKRKM